MDEHAVFGRVAPRQKQAMVKALQARGHTVAMTGDGVNDVLALKLADLGIAMGSGAAATRAVAELVLLDGSFATLPGVVAEGRRVMANIERVAGLFITKTVWAALLAVAVGVTLLPYPFLPRHLTIVDTLAIGVPSFFLALAPNRRRYQPGFAGRVLRFAVPSGCIVAAAAFAAYVQARAAGLPLTGQLTTATVVTLILSMCVLIRQAVPLTWPRAVMIAALLAAFALLFPVPAVRDFYGLAPPGDNLWATLLIAALGIVALAVSWRVWPRQGGGRAARTRRACAEPVPARGLGRRGSALLADAGDRAHRRGQRQPQPDRHHHGGDVAERPDPDVAVHDAREDHQNPGADKEKRARRGDPEEVLHDYHPCYQSGVSGLSG